MNIITIPIAVALVIWMLITSRKNNIVKALLPVWVLSAVCLVGFLWAVNYNQGSTVKTDTFSMENGYEASLSIKYKDNKAIAFGKLGIYDPSGQLVDQESFDTDSYEQNVYEDIEKYFETKHDLKGRSVENSDLNGVVLYDTKNRTSLTFYPSSFLTSMLQGDLALLAIFAFVRFHKFYRRKRNEMKRLRIESEL